MYGILKPESPNSVFLNLFQDFNSHLCEYFTNFYFQFKQMNCVFKALCVLSYISLNECLVFEEANNITHLP